MSVNLESDRSVVFSEYALDLNEPSMKKVREWIDKTLNIEKILTFGIVVDTCTLLQHLCLAYTSNGQLAVALRLRKESWKQFVLCDINEPLTVTIQNESQICWLTESGSIGMVTSLSILSQNDKQFTILTTTVEDIKLSEMSSLWLPDVTFSGHCQPHIAIMCFESRDKEQKFKAFDLFANLGKLDLVNNKSIETLFPMGYESLCLALQLVSIQGKQMMLVATADNRLSLFCKQAIVGSCSIPIIVQSITTAVVNKNTIALLQSIDSSVCIVNCHQFEVVGNYSRVVKWLVGDFTRKGHQLLILFMSNSVEHGFVLTDFECSYSTSSFTDSCADETSENADQEDTSCPNGLIQALEALQNRLVTAKVQLVDKKMLLCNKKRLLQGAAMQLPRLATDCENDSTLKWFTDSSLVKLIGEDDKRSSKKDDYHSNASKELPLIVVGEFQRNVYNKWVLAIDVENISKYDIDNLAFDLVSLVGSDGTSSHFRSKSYMNLKSSAEDESADQLESVPESSPKRKRLDVDVVKFDTKNSASSIVLCSGHQATLLTVTDCPTFKSTSKMIATVCVSFRIMDSSKASVCSSQQRQSEILMLHHQFGLSLHQLVDDAFTVKTTADLIECCSCKHAEQDRLSFHAVALTCSLTVQVAASCVVHQVVQSVCREFGMNVGDSHTVSTSNMFKLANLSERQYDILITIGTVDDKSHSFRIHVLYHSATDLSCFLCYLCRSLPPDAVVYCSTHERCHPGNLITIEEETQRLTDFLQHVIIDSRGSDNVSLRCYLGGYKV